MSCKHIIDPGTVFIPNLDETNLDETDFMVRERYNHSFVLDLGFLNDIILWNVEKYASFLEKVRHDICCEYDFIVGVNEPCKWVYKNGYLFYTVWDCGQWFNSYKIKMNEELLTKLYKISTQIKENICNNN
jgi:hypothetical protein